MIITQTPLRVSFAGGGSDLPSHYLKNGGCVVSAAISKRIFIFMHKCFDSNTVLKYSKTETVCRNGDIEHPIIHAIFSKYNMENIELSVIADVPAGTGLGSSSAFTVGLLRAVREFLGYGCSGNALAKEACDIEIAQLQEKIGKQDQYAAAMGGLNFIEFHSDESVTIEAIPMSAEVLENMQSNLVMFYTGCSRHSRTVLNEQNLRTERSENQQNLRKICKLARSMKEALIGGDLHGFAEIINENWRLKQTLSPGIVNSKIMDMYDVGMRNGAVAGKLLGAGGGGFMLFYCEKEKQYGLAQSLALPPYFVRFDFEGSKTIINDKHGCSL